MGTGMMNNSNGMPGPGMHRKKMMMHMTFFWGKNAEILFHGWPGTRAGMYALSLIVVFVLAAMIEGLSHSRFIKGGTSNLRGGLIQTGLHGMRVGLAYLVMLAVMSFNGGVFLAAVAGHVVGFFFFGSRAFNKEDSATNYGKTTDLPPLSC